MKKKILFQFKEKTYFFKMKGTENFYFQGISNYKETSNRELLHVYNLGTVEEFYYEIKKKFDKDYKQYEVSFFIKYKGRYEHINNSEKNYKHKEGSAILTSKEIEKKMKEDIEKAREYYYETTELFSLVKNLPPVVENIFMERNKNDKKQK